MDLSFGRADVDQEDVWINHLNAMDSVKVFVGKQVGKELRKLDINGQRLSSGAIILDTGSKVSIFNNKELFGRIYESNKPIIIDGINAVSEGLLVLEEGMTEFGVVYYNSRASANILSYGDAVDNYDRVQYDSDQDSFFIRVSAFQPLYVFRRDHKTGMYIYRTDENNEAVFDGLYDANAPGVVFYTSSNEVGDFKVGPNFKIVQSTGTIEGDIFQRSILTLVSPLMLVLE